MYITSSIIFFVLHYLTLPYIILVCTQGYGFGLISLPERAPWRPRPIMMSAGVVNQLQLVSPLTVYGALLPHAR